MTLSAPLYCSERCKEMASYVRYARSCRSSGRDRWPAIAETILVRRSFVLKGIDPAREPEVPDIFCMIALRKAKGCCEKCGVTLDIDRYNRDTDRTPRIHHLDGSSNKESNLRIWCGKCKSEDTRSRSRPIEEGSSHDPYARELDARVLADVPVLICDDEKEWQVIWRKLSKEAKEVLRKREDLDE